jgi:hypothetical protein
MNVKTFSVNQLARLGVEIKVFNQQQKNSSKNIFKRVFCLKATLFADEALVKFIGLDSLPGFKISISK